MVQANHRKSGFMRAVKIIEKPTLKLKDKAREREAMKKVAEIVNIDDPNICKVVDVFEDAYHFYIVSRLLNEDLAHRLLKRN